MAVACDWLLWPLETRDRRREGGDVLVAVLNLPEVDDVDGFGLFAGWEGFIHQ